MRPAHRNIVAVFVIISTGLFSLFGQQEDQLKHWEHPLLEASRRTKESYRNSAEYEPTTRTIPSKFWDAEISDLEPVEVYVARVNTYVVLKKSKEWEYGIFIPDPYSSSLGIHADEDYITLKHSKKYDYKKRLD